MTALAALLRASRSCSWPRATCSCRTCATWRCGSASSCTARSRAGARRCTGGSSRSARGAFWRARPWIVPRRGRLRLLRGALAPGLERGEPERNGWPVGLAQAAAHLGAGIPAAARAPAPETLGRARPTGAAARRRSPPAARTRPGRPTRSGSAAIRLAVARRPHDVEVQVRLRRVARVAAVADQLARGDALARLHHRVLAQVDVAPNVAVGVQDRDEVGLVAQFVAPAAFAERGDQPRRRRPSRSCGRSHRDGRPAVRASRSRTRTISPAEWLPSTRRRAPRLPLRVRGCVAPNGISD